MPNFEFIDDKRPETLEAGEHIIHEDKFWRITANHSILGYPTHTRRMLMIVPHQFAEGRACKFLEIVREGRIAAYRKTE